MEQDLRSIERRQKIRFPIIRDVRYRLLDDDTLADYGAGETIDMGSGGISFSTGQQLKEGCYIELSINWPVLLDDICPMRLVVYGQVLRSDCSGTACTVDKYEFRTRARLTLARPNRSDAVFQRWAEGLRKVETKAHAYHAVA